MRRVDFSVFSPEGNRVALVEAKARRGTTPQWAREFRDSMLEAIKEPRELFLLATPEWFYFWNSTTELHREPDLSVAAPSLLAEYLRRANLSQTSLSPAAFEQIVGWWLRDLADKGGPTPNEELNASGLPDVVRGGRVESEELAA